MGAQNSGPEQRRAKPRGRGFKKGESGNPGGRPKEEREVVELLRLHGEEYVRALLKLVRAKKPNVRAVEVAMDRAYGKAKQVVELGGRDGGPIQLDLTRLTVEQLRQWIELAKAAGEAPGPDARGP